MGFVLATVVRIKDKARVGSKGEHEEYVGEEQAPEHCVEVSVPQELNSCCNGGNLEDISVGAVGEFSNEHVAGFLLENPVELDNFHLDSEASLLALRALFLFVPPVYLINLLKLFLQRSNLLRSKVRRL